MVDIEMEVKLIVMKECLWSELLPCWSPCLILMFRPNLINYLSGYETYSTPKHGYVHI